MNELTQQVVETDITMKERIHSLDWSATPVGDMGSWPQSLKATIKMLLGSRYPMILLWGEELIQIYNDAYTGLIGDKHPYALGRSIKETQAESWDTIGPMIKHVMTTGISNWVPAQLLAVDRTGFNEETYFSLSYSAVENDENVITGMLCVCSEVTQQVLGERRLRIQRDLASRTGEIRDIDKVCVDIATIINEYSADVPFMQLYLKDEKGGVKLVTSVGIDDTSLAGDHWPLSRAMAGETIFLPNISGTEHIRKGIWNDPVEDALVLPVPSSDPGAPLGIIVAGISPNCVFDDSYRSFFELLASQVSVSLRNALAYEEERKRAEALAEIDRAKTAFFSNVSHEFRTPLTLMLGPLEDLLGNAARSLSVADKEQLTTAYQNALRLLKLVNSLLDFSRIEANRAQALYTPVDIGKLTSELASSFESAIRKASIDYIIDCPSVPDAVYIDSEMWEKIIFNLISNALKFTFEGTITIRIKEYTDSISLEVSDTGVGIPHHELPNLFKRFHRINNSRSRSHEGTGIGLALTKELVALHGGNITVSSEEGRGTTFKVTIPKGTEHLDKTHIGAADTSRPGNILKESYTNEASLWTSDTADTKFVDDEHDEVEYVSRDEDTLILVVDDNVQMLSYLQRILYPHWSVETAKNGREALEFISDKKPDLILSDVMMPEMNGFELLSEIRKKEEWSTIPVILLSARAGQESTVEGLEKGASDYLVKPFHARELIARIGAQLEIKRTRLDNMILRESEKKFRTLAESTPEKVWCLDREGKLIYWNSNMQVYTGLPAEKHENWLNFTHPDDLVLTGEVWATANARKEPYELECRFLRYDGEYRWHITRAVPEKNTEGDIIAWIGTCTDIHDQKLFSEELEKKVQERTYALKKSNNELEQFAYAASHDLQEPLRKIVMFSELLNKNLSDSEEQSKTYIEKISASSERMRILINDLLNFSRLSAAVTFVSVDLNEVLTEVLSDLEHLITEKDATVHSGKLPVVEAIPLQMSQLFYNLMSNALKFTAHDRKPYITVTSKQLADEDIKQYGSLDPREQYVKIEVTDNGIGFAQEYTSQIFTIFKRLNNRVVYSGTGIGLALCRK